MATEYMAYHLFENVENKTKLLEYVKTNRDAIALKESQTYPVTFNEAKEQIDLAVLLMEGLFKKIIPRATYIEDGKLNYVNSNTSIFETIVDIFTYVSVSMNQLYYDSSNRPAVHDILLAIAEHVKREYKNKSFFDIERKLLSQTYCTLIIFDVSDMESAVDIIGKSWNYLGTPWCVRNVLVHEHIIEKFNKSIKRKLKPINMELFNQEHRAQLENSYQQALENATALGLNIVQNENDRNLLKKTLIYGTMRPHIDLNPAIQAPVVTVNTFRTAKEATVLSNDSSSISIFSSDIAVSYEVAHNSKSLIAWINCHGLLNGAIPFSFRPNEFTYGSELCILEKTLWRRNLSDNTAPTPADENTSNITFDIFSAVVNVANHHFETFGIPRNITSNNKVQMNRRCFSEYKIDNADQRRLHGRILFEQKSIVFAFGTSF